MKNFQTHITDIVGNETWYGDLRDSESIFISFLVRAFRVSPIGRITQNFKMNIHTFFEASHSLQQRNFSSACCI